MSPLFNCRDTSADLITRILRCQTPISSHSENPLWKNLRKNVGWRENFSARFCNKNCFSLAKIPKIPQDINDAVIFIKISLVISILTSNFAVDFVITNQTKEQRLVLSVV